MNTYGLPKGKAYYGQFNTMSVPTRRVLKRALKKIERQKGKRQTKELD